MRSDTNAKDDGTLTWLLHDLIDQKKITPAVAIAISHRIEGKSSTDNVPPTTLEESRKAQRMMMIMLACAELQNIPVKHLLQAMQNVEPHNLDKILQGFSAIAIALTGDRYIDSLDQILTAAREI
jgi:hypothetical protein